MKRCLELARLGIANVSPNPMVGAVLVHDGRIIGEGYHQQYGKPHAEVNCISSVAGSEQALVKKSTLYVSLEPCAHFGKTPPCADLIIKHQIPRVIVGCRDPFEEVNGKGIEKLQSAGIDVITGIMEAESKDLNKRFFTFHTKYRPYIILKWAETKDGFMASSSRPSFNEEDDESSDRLLPGPGRLLISNEYSNRLVHKWRSEEAAILVGTNTALIDNPELTTRLWTGHSPVRLVLDLSLRLPPDLKIFNRQVRTIIFNSIKEGDDNGLQYYRLNKGPGIIRQMMAALYGMNIQSVLVEGGAKMLQSFIEEGCWDEARVITNQLLTLADNRNGAPGLKAPLPGDYKLVEESRLDSDIVKIFKPNGDDR